MESVCSSRSAASQLLSSPIQYQLSDRDSVGLKSSKRLRMRLVAGPGKELGTACFPLKPERMASHQSAPRSAPKILATGMQGRSQRFPCGLLKIGSMTALKSIPSNSQGSGRSRSYSISLSSYCLGPRRSTWQAHRGLELVAIVGRVSIPWPVKEVICACGIPATPANT